MASLKPIIDEELGMLSELASIEDVMQKLGRVTTNPDLLPEAAEQVIDDAASYEVNGGSSLCLATPPSTPSGSQMGSRQSSMCSIASISSASVRPESECLIPMSPSRQSVTSVDQIVTRHRSFNQYDFASLRRGQKNGSIISSMYNGGDGYTASSDRPTSALSASVSFWTLASTTILW